MLSEIEQKVLSLLEDCGNSAGHQQETEALSLKLKEVKCNLEKVQMMLQDKYNEEQVKQMNAMQSKNKSHGALMCCSNRRRVRAHHMKQGKEKSQSEMSDLLLFQFALLYNYL